ncbi:MAG: 2-amino-4-hydroxy-6-hydroxymethyldihydropteridine diphosphokinase [Microscillaceae bacterium]|nr:2-amino-4-hydroxy-6-hydroxymethyldihydropteridine diphosphokinase [Microscillaceae bacterium]
MSFILLGTNLGDRRANLFQAIDLLSCFVGDIIRESSIYETAPWGVSQQPNYFNQVIQFETDLDAEELLLTTQQIEEKMGREDKGKMLPRVIDIDILYFDNQVLNKTHLQIPHPEIANRRFTLVPLVEIAPNFVHPVLKKNHHDLLKICPDTLPVNKV